MEERIIKRREEKTIYMETKRRKDMNIHVRSISIQGKRNAWIEISADSVEECEEEEREYRGCER